MRILCQTIKKLIITYKICILTFINQANCKAPMTPTNMIESLKDYVRIGLWTTNIAEIKYIVPNNFT